VGLCSYLLIGFWFERERATNAGKKAFIVNRIGDFGFLLGLALIFATFGSLRYDEVFQQASAVLHDRPLLATLIGLLLFVGAVGKSAQLPLYVWLPDAMEGPTPVSALIHAATMVTAGVYMVSRTSALYVQAPVALAVIAVVGVLTAFFAATVALAQNDIKRILAYSTISQLGYMFLGCGVGAFWAAIFHLTTHAFFKALLFMGAGSVIHALNGEMDIRRMGGLGRYLPTTQRTFFWATLAIAGCPLLSGFFSKDAILYAAWHAPLFPFAPILLWGLGMVTAVLTALYMMRLYGLTFLGQPRMEEATLAHVHESPPVMLKPMVILMWLSILGGVVGLPGPNLMEPFISSVTVLPHWVGEHAPSLAGEWAAGLIAGLIAIAALYIGYLLFGAPQPLLRAWAERRPWAEVIALAREQWRVEWAYRRFVVEPGFRFAGWLASVMEPLVIDGFVNGLAETVLALGQGFRRWQTGYVRAYILAFTLGAFLVVMYFLFAHLFVGAGGS
jgi:NADH-quinone oxidoreductase subunit L